jgi:hypothetical protein
LHALFRHGVSVNAATQSNSSILLTRILAAIFFAPGAGRSGR